MSDSLDQLKSLASTGTEESDLLDFKREFAPEKKSAFWAETIKDIVAFANTRGGALVFGLEDDGSLSENNVHSLLDYDNAAIGDQIKKYTESNFSAFSIAEVQRPEGKFPCILVLPVSPPLVFSKPGTYEIEKGKQKNAFSVGTIYVRHGSKSEPCRREDLQKMFDEALLQVRDQWLSNIRKVVEAPFGSTVVVANSAITSNEVRITSNQDAPSVRILKLSDGFPHRQSDVIKRVNTRLSTPKKINSHDIQAIKFVEGVDDTRHPDLVHKPHSKSSPQFSDSFIELICGRYKDDSNYFEKCRKSWRTAKYLSK